MKCKICEKDVGLFDTATILDKYKIQYYKCSHCGFIQTEDPFWLEESYSSPITSSDIGLIQRNIQISQKLDVLFRILHLRKGKFLDFGGGYGILVRMMRDKGYDFEWYDEYCENLFAKSHEKKHNQYDVITSFEMLEHLATPRIILDKLFEMTGCLIFTTKLVPDSVPKVEDWWYYGTEHGQHVSFYSIKTMEEIGRRYKRKYHNIGGLHIFSNEFNTPKRLFFETALKVHAYVFFRHNNVSLLNSDYAKLRG